MILRREDTHYILNACENLMEFLKIYQINLHLKIKNININPFNN